MLVDGELTEQGYKVVVRYACQNVHRVLHWTPRLVTYDKAKQFYLGNYILYVLRGTCCLAYKTLYAVARIHGTCEPAAARLAICSRLCIRRIGHDDRAYHLCLASNRSASGATDRLLYTVSAISQHSTQGGTNLQDNC